MNGDMREALTEREREILALIVQGLSNQAIADQLFLTLGTVKWYNKSIYSKLGVRSRTQAVAQARELSLMSFASSLPHRPRLPTWTTSFIGREYELDGIQRRLTDPDCRLLTLFGPGGIGKTRLALEAAYRYNQAADGVYFCPLQATPSPQVLIPTIADTVTLMLSGRQEPKAKLLEFLADKSLLLVLDNFEHLLDGRDLLAELLDAAPQLKIMVTSRVLLSLQSEWLFSVHGLSWPKEFTVDNPESYPAVALFISRAHQSALDFKVDPVMADIIHICQLVEGMPLGIELATAWLKLLNCAEIAANIERGIDFLATRYEDVPSRHRSLRAVFEQSWLMLMVEEQSIFQRLAVFRGGFDVQAAEKVAGASLFSLSSLLEKSLLQRDEAGRFHIHDLLRQYAAERLASSNEEFGTSDAHAAYFANFLHQRRVDTTCGRQRQAGHEIGLEIDNIRAAWRWAIKQGNAGYIQQSVYPLYQYFRFTSRYREAQDTFRDAVMQLATHSLETAGIALAELLCYQGWTCTRSGDIETAQAVFEQSYAIYETLGLAPTPGVATDPLSGFGTLALIRGDYAEAIRIGEKALARSNTWNDQWNRMQALYILAGASLAQGDFQLARQQANKALNILRDGNENWMIAYVHIQLGSIARALGNYEEAQRQYEASYTVREAYEDREGMALTLNQLAMLAYLQGDYGQARRLYEQSHRMYLEIGDRGGMGTALNGQGVAACAMGDKIGAREFFQQAMRIALEIQFAPLIVSALVGFGELCLKTGRVTEGIGLLMFAQTQPGTHQEVRIRAVQLLAVYAVDDIEAGRKWVESRDRDNIIALPLEDKD
jgi:predicted ATPase/DNA-binding CsgD family transcriptional regulator